MSNCNTTQNERAGKDMLLKICKDLSITVAIGTADTPTNLLAVAHGLTVNDVIYFDTLPGTVSEVTIDTPYFVKSVTADNFKIASTPGGSAISFTHAMGATTVEAFQTVGGLRTSTFSFGADSIETTNYGSNQWKEVLDGAGIKSCSVSGDGVFTNLATYIALETAFLANALKCLALIDVVAGKVYKGCFKITSLELGASFDGEGTFSISADSSGQVHVDTAA